MFGCMCQLLLGYVRQQREPSCVGMGGKKAWLSARGHREPDAGSAGQMLGEVVISKTEGLTQALQECVQSQPSHIPARTGEAWAGSGVGKNLCKLERSCCCPSQEAALSCSGLEAACYRRAVVPLQWLTLQDAKADSAHGSSAHIG